MFACRAGEWRVGVLFGLWLSLCCGLLPVPVPHPCLADDTALAAGRELFLREWIPGDARSHGGDGLGPVFNDTSCVACHNQGGVGGSGPAAKNAQIVTAFANANEQDSSATATLFLSTATLLAVVA
jgi:CxxC motif-containing protein (DUF1111 family)